MQDGVAAALLPVGLAVIMVGIGLSLTPSQFRQRLNSTAIVGWALAGQIILVPLVAIALAFVLGLPPILAIGLVLLAAAPGGITTNLFTHLGKGNVPLSIVLTVISSLAMMATMPFWVWVGTRIFTDPTGGMGVITVPPAEALGLVIGVVGIPVALGMVIRAKKPTLADTLEKFTSIIGIVVLVGIFAFLIIDLGGELLPLLEQVGIAVILFNALIMALGWAIPAALKRPVEDKIAVSVEYGLRNSTMAMVIALTVIGSTEIAAPAMLFSVTMYVFGVALVIWRRRSAGERHSPDPVRR